MDYQKKLHHLIPGGAHTYSRGDDQFPDNAPAILSHGKDCYVWDPNGTKYLDYGMGLRSVSIGYAYKPIVEAALAQINNGNALPRPSVIELEAAESLTSLIPGADMVKFAKNGSNVTTAAIKLARAYTGKKYIAVCSDHPFFSFDDWFIGSTVVNRGITEEEKKLTKKFDYNDISSLKKLFERYKNNIAAVIMEPATSISPKKDCDQCIKSRKCTCPDTFLHQVRQLCDANQSVFILDEMITGFRWHLEGAQKFYNVQADLTTFGKAMANGFSVACLAGKREIMNLGGISDEGAERVFLISTTHGAEMCGLGAFVKTIEVYKELKVIDHLWQYGRKLIDGINSISESLGIIDYFYVEGYSCSPTYVTKDQEGVISMEFRTLFSQEMVNNGVLMPWIALSYSHGNKELKITFDAVEKSLIIYKKALENGYKNYLNSEVIKPVFRKNN
jgi:glutamate-1-semialdehyde 2,1-aminomutase